MRTLLTLIIFLFFLVHHSSSSAPSYLCYTSSKKITSDCTEWTDGIHAWATYDQKEGWHLFTVETNPNSSNQDQSFSAGYLEGFIYSDYINYHYNNIIKSIYNGKLNLSTEAKAYINEQNQFISSKRNAGNDEYNEALRYIWTQHEGMYTGYTDKYISSGDKSYPLLTKEEFYTITYLGDLYDITSAFPVSATNLKDLTNRNNNPKKECTVYIKYFPLKNQLYCAHNTHNIYTMMNRIFKTYKLNIRLYTNGKYFNHMSFSSRPGDLNSKDDYYTLSNNMIIWETSLEVYDKSIYAKLSPLSIPKWIRVNIANRLSEGNDDWVRYFSRFNSGTHNDQWIIVDYNMFYAKSKEKVVYIIEQTPNISNMYYNDLTEMLYREQYVGGYNAAYDKRAALDLGAKGEQTYYEAKRYFIIKDLDKGVNEIDDIKKVMEFHEKDNLCNTVGARCDMSDGWPFGAIDVKISCGGMKSVIKYGPPFIEGVSTPFDWREKYGEYSRVGIPDRFDFKYIEVDYK